jgi:sarcosine oxidase subunit beta
VIGGGVYGAAVTWQLARRGASVALLERHTIASGASGGPGVRGVRANGRDSRELPLMRTAYELWPKLDDELGADTGYQQRGSLELIEEDTSQNEPSWAAVLARQQLQNAHGIPTELLSRAEVLQKEPGIGPAVTAALYCPLDGIADHTATTRAYAAAATKAGADVREDSPVVSLTPGRRGTQIETADGEHMLATTGVFVLVNSYALDLLARPFGLQLPLWRLAPQVSLTRPTTEFRLEHLIGHGTRNLAAKVLHDGTIMLSGSLRGRWDSTADAGSADPEVLQQSLADAADVFPALTGAVPVSVDASRPESYSVDYIPVIDRLPGTDHVFFATGWSGHGFAIAPAVADSLATWALDGQHPPELRPFSLDRLHR